MLAITYPLRVLLLTVTGLVPRHQADVIAYLVEENRVLNAQLQGRQLRLTGDQRRRLAAKAKRLGRRALSQVATIVTPDTLMRWHRRLIALNWTSGAKRVGRPGRMKAIKALIVRMASGNSTWGYCRIQGELMSPGHTVASSTIAYVLKENGIQPAPDRPSSWRSFLRAHRGQVAATDFLTAEVWTPFGLRTYYVLFMIDLRTRAVHVASVTVHPGDELMAQVARNLTDCVDGFLRSHRILICDHDTKYTAQFKRILKDAGVCVVPTPVRAPNCNAFAERWVLSIKSECLDRMIFCGERSLRRAVTEYVEHYNAERAHQGIGNVPIRPAEMGEGKVECRGRLKGILKHDYRAA